MIGHKIYNLAKKLFPINRSLTGDGVLLTLNEFKKINNNLKIMSFPSKKKVFDWKIPLEWNVKDAWVKQGDKKIIDFKKSNLSLVGYSMPINKVIDFKELNKHLYSIPSQQNAIPYITSYYKKNWGFCLKHKTRIKLNKKKKYHVFIDASHKNGKMNYGEILIPGKSKKEILFSTYICHPSMANNELSGPTLLIYLSRFIQKVKKRNFTYRFVFVPETIGSIAYINKNLSILKKNVIAGFNVTCVGDNRSYSYLPSKNGNTFSDHAILYLLKKNNIKYKKYSWLDRGSDERQYCSPGVDLPIASLMRSKYLTYKEYHTSLDNLGTVVTKKGLDSSFKLYQKLFYLIENNIFFKQINYCELFLSGKGLYPQTIQKFKKYEESQDLSNFLSYCDGKTSIYQILNKCNLNYQNLKKIYNLALRKKLINKKVEPF